MIFFEQELKRLIDRGTVLSDVCYAGRACFGNLGGDNRAKLQFVTLGTADHYTGLKATVLNREDGPVDSVVLRFADIWGKKQVSNPNFREGVTPYIWTDMQENDWYVYRPTDMDFSRLAGALNAYLDVFRDKTLVPEKNRANAKESVTQKLRDADKTTAPRKASAKKREPEL